MNDPVTQKREREREKKHYHLNSELSITTGKRLPWRDSKRDEASEMTMCSFCKNNQHHFPFSVSCSDLKDASSCNFVNAPSIVLTRSIEYLNAPSIVLHLFTIVNVSFIEQTKRL